MTNLLINNLLFLKIAHNREYFIREWDGGGGVKD